MFFTGQITLTSVEQVSVFGEDNPLTVESQLSKPIVERVFVQPIVVSDDDGSNTATAFGNAEQEAEIERRVNRIYNQAGVEVVFLQTKQFNNTFANGVGEGERDLRDFGKIFNLGDAAGVSSSDPLVLNYYFINRVPGFDLPGGGRARIGQSGARTVGWYFRP